MHGPHIHKKKDLVVTNGRVLCNGACVNGPSETTKLFKMFTCVFAFCFFLQYQMSDIVLNMRGCYISFTLITLVNLSTIYNFYSAAFKNPGIIQKKEQQS